MGWVLKALVVIAALIAVMCEAQLTFTPNWGKRSGLQDGPCKLSTEVLMHIYKLVETEAQKLVECGKFGGN
uniref:Adipokinetic hormone preproprotein n=1 Tax=Periplaneta americana TaxID=6978 RepID=Q5EY02_PERAM|nr:adipokinetic hormone preproprotein [Periplaneta americana]